MKPTNDMDLHLGALSRRLGALLKRHGRTLSTAESCTGGMVAKVITDVPGSSGYFMGGIVSYSDEAKTKLLRVERVLIENHGAVSKEVAGAMARGVQGLMRTDCAIAVTGIAGPGGGTEQKPVGLVYIAVADRRKIRIKKFVLKSGRDGNRGMTTALGIRMLMALLKS